MLTTLLWMLLSITSTGLASNEGGTLNKRSTDKLEYVIRVLEDQGRLNEVDGELLERIQATIQRSKSKAEKTNISEGRVGVQDDLPRTSLVDKAKIRQQQLFGVRSQHRSPPPQSRTQSSTPARPRLTGLFPGRNQLVGGECQALKTENSILKQQLLAAQSQQQQQQQLGTDSSARTLSLLNSIQVKLFT